MNALELFVMAVVSVVVWIATAGVLWLIARAAFHHATRHSGSDLPDGSDVRPVVHSTDVSRKGL